MSNVNAFLKIDGIDGESTESGHDKWIEVLSHSHGIIQPTSSTRSSSGGASTGSSEHGDFTITKSVDLASPKLFEAASTGKHFSKATIDFMRQAGDSKVKYMSVALEEVMISSVHSNGNGGVDLPTEAVGLNYGKIEWTYTQQKRKDGSGGGNATGKYDLTKQK
jgi:type VI secretion system secreted protein Hcp